MKKILPIILGVLLASLVGIGIYYAWETAKIEIQIDYLGSDNIT